MFDSCQEGEGLISFLDSMGAEDEEERRTEAKRRERRADHVGQRASCRRTIHSRGGLVIAAAWVVQRAGAGPEITVQVPVNLTTT